MTVASPTTSMTTRLTAPSLTGWEVGQSQFDAELIVTFEGVRNVTYSLCVEMWGGPPNPDCFVQFNPPSGLLKRALEPLMDFFVVSFHSMIADFLGMAAPTADTAPLLCKIRTTHNQLLALQWQLNSLVI